MNDNEKIRADKKNHGLDKNVDTLVLKKYVLFQDSKVHSHNSQQLKKELDSCKEQQAVWKERFMRVTADLENYKRRTEKERMAWAEAAQIKLLTDLLPIVDDFDRAFQEQGIYEDKDVQAWLTGLAMIYKSLQKYLQTIGITEISTEQAFDPELHEALVQVDSPDHESGSVVEVMQKGYLFKGNVLRPAKVSVAK